MDNEEPPSKRQRLTSKSPPPRIDNVPRSSQTEAEKEHLVGIRAYANPNSKPFSAILKTRYTDFIVNELLPNGHVVHLTDTTAAKTQKVEPSGHTNGAQQARPSKLPNIAEEHKTKLAELLNAKAAEEIVELYESIKIGKPKQIVRTEFTTDRTLRGKIHQFIRSTFSGAIDSTTEQDGNLALKPIMKGGKKNPRNQQRNWSEGGYLHFTLYKENKDTMEVISRLSRQMKMNVKSFSFAGTKDRRAVTSQRCSAYHVEADRLAAQNRQLWGSKVGDFSYHKHGLELGELSGNEFTITLRDVNAGCDIDSLKSLLVDGMKSLREQGYINYYGQQRFGTFSVRTDDIGRHILKENFSAAIDAILSYPKEIPEDANRDDKDRATAISKWRADNKLNEALDVLPRKFSAEASIIRHLTRNPNDHLGALLTVQRNLRLMYVHAYQSLVWNLAASHRIQVGTTVIAGDLVLIKEHNLAETKQVDIIDENGEEVINPAGEDAAVDKDDVFERARALTEEEAASGRFSMFDIVLPQPGYDIEYPINATGEFYKTYMASFEGGELDPHSMRRKQRDFSLSGAYRKVLARIDNGWEVEVHKYCKDEEQFVKTDMDRLNEKDGGTSNGQRDDKPKDDEGTTDSAMDVEKLAAVLKFKLGTSQYATMALRELSKGGITAHKAEFTTAR